MKVVIDTHPLWDAQICGAFIATLMLVTDPEIKRLAASNFRKYYKGLSVGQRTELRLAIHNFKMDPQAALREQSDLLNELSEDDEVIDKIKKSDQ